MRSRFINMQDDHVSLIMHDVVKHAPHVVRYRGFSAMISVAKSIGFHFVYEVKPILISQD